MPTLAASVLTVEDNPIIRADLREVLERAGFSVCADARDGIEALELARRHEPDVILLDIGLPRLDGVEVTRRILAEREVPIVALTGRSIRHAEQAIDAGAMSYVTKPFAEEHVVDALHAALAVHREREHREARAASLRAITQLVGLLGYPDGWAVELEQQAFERGHLWRIESGPKAGADEDSR